MLNFRTENLFARFLKESFLIEKYGVWKHKITKFCLKPMVAKPEVFGWSRIPNNTRSQSQIFCPTPDVQLDHFLHHTTKLGIPVETV